MEHIVRLEVATKRFDRQEKNAVVEATGMRPRFLKQVKEDISALKKKLLNIVGNPSRRPSRMFYKMMYAGPAWRFVPAGTQSDVASGGINMDGEDRDMATPSATASPF